MLKLRFGMSGDGFILEAEEVDDSPPPPPPPPQKELDFEW
jgi:hypothetical protein